MERTDQPKQQPSPEQPQPNSILRQPATVKACQADYAAGTDVRRRLGWKDPA